MAAIFLNERLGMLSLTREIMSINKLHYVALFHIGVEAQNATQAKKGDFSFLFISRV